MKKTRTKKPRASQKGDFTESQKKFIREFARETALAAREIWQSMQPPTDEFIDTPEELAAMMRGADSGERDARGRFVRRS